MSSFKNFTNDYALTSLTNGNINLTGRSINVYGNLNVVGISTQTTVSNASITNNFIILNDGYAGGPLLDSGMLVNRGTTGNVVLKYSETYSSWQLTNDGLTFGNILVDVTGLTATPLTSGNVFIDYSAANTAIPGTTVISAGIPGPGSSGLRVTTPNEIFKNEELIIKTKALIYTTLL